MTPLDPDTDRDNTESKFDDANDGPTRKKFEEDAQAAKQEAGAKAQEKAEAGQHRAAGEADALSDAIDAAASNLDEHDREGLARYARELSGHLSSAAGQLEDRSVDELASDAKRLARDNPALFMLGSISVGFGLSRFLKASAERDHRDGDRSGKSSDTDQSADTNPNDDAWNNVPPQGRERDMRERTGASSAPTNGNGSGML